MYTELRKEYPRTWRIWHRMNWRCERADLFPCYEDVSVCDEWNRQVSGEEGFIQFFEDIGDLDTTGKTIYRVDKFDSWNPLNVEFCDNREYAHKTRWHQLPQNQFKITAKENGISGATLRTRLDLGWNIQRAITQPVAQYKKHKKKQ